jgi:hypothetical protein
MTRRIQLVTVTHVGLSRSGMHQGGTALTHPCPGVQVVRVTFVVLTRLLWIEPWFGILHYAERSQPAFANVGGSSTATEDRLSWV